MALEVKRVPGFAKLTVVPNPAALNTVVYAVLVAAFQPI